MQTKIDVGEIVVYRNKEYDVLDKTPDGNLILGKNHNAQTEVSEKLCSLKQKEDMFESVDFGHKNNNKNIRVRGIDIMKK